VHLSILCSSGALEGLLLINIKVNLAALLLALDDSDDEEDDDFELTKHLLVLNSIKFETEKF
jgi:hypothetical protein